MKDFGYKIDKTKLEELNMSEAPDDKAFWLTKTPAERFGALEFTRQVFYGYSTPPRLQRILEVVDRT